MEAKTIYITFDGKVSKSHAEALNHAKRQYKAEVEKFARHLYAAVRDARVPTPTTIALALDGMPARLLMRSILDWHGEMTAPDPTEEDE